MKDPMKPRDKITQKMSRDGLTEQNQTTGESELISKRIQDADFQKTPEQQAAQDAAQLQGAVSPSSPLPHAPEHFSKPQDAAAERVMEHIGAGQTRKASKKAVRRAQEAAASKAQPSRLQFTDEERATPELEKYIKKSDKAADRLDAARAALPPKKKSRLQFDKQETPPSFEGKRNPLSRPAQEAGIFVHNKIHSVEKDNSGVEGAHKSEEAAERMGKYGVRKVKEGYRSHKLKPYRKAAQAEKAAAKANANFYYHKALALCGKAPGRRTDCDCRAAFVHHYFCGAVLLFLYVFRRSQRRCGDFLHIGGQRPCGGGKQLRRYGKRTASRD